MTAFTIDETITLKSLDDITRRPNYLAKLDPKKKFHRHIVAIYSFPREQAQCSIQSCLQLHGNGFLVMTSEKKEVCLCEDCGAKHFETTFEEQQAIFSTKDRVRGQKIRLNAVLEQEDSIKDRIKALKQAAMGANWLYRSLENFRKTYPKDLLSALEELAINKDDNRVVEALIESDADSISIEAIGQLQGLEIFAIDIKEVLIGNILKPLKALVDCANNPDAGLASIASYCKWSDKLEEHFTRAESLVEQGRAFFTPENLLHLTSIPVSEKSAKQVKSLRWDCKNAMALGKK